MNENKDLLKERAAKLIDLKSIITILLILTLVILVITFVIKNGTLEEKLFLLFSNVTTMVITYYFTRKNINEDKAVISQEDVKTNNLSTKK